METLEVFKDLCTILTVCIVVCHVAIGLLAMAAPRCRAGVTSTPRANPRAPRSDLYALGEVHAVGDYSPGGIIAIGRHPVGHRLPNKRRRRGRNSSSNR